MDRLDNANECFRGAGFVEAFDRAKFEGFFDRTRRDRAREDNGRNPDVRSLAQETEHIERASLRHLNVENKEMRKGMGGAVGKRGFPFYVSDGIGAVADAVEVVSQTRSAKGSLKKDEVIA